MRMAQLGDGGPTISVIGFGAWAVGGDWEFGWGPQDDDASVAAIRHAVDLGVTWVDTAAVYGFGHSEEIVGRAIAGMDEILVFTKCGVLGADQGTTRSLAPESIRTECEASLRRLGRDHIDVYQFHWPDPSVPVEDSWTVMLELVDSGKVRWPGVSNFDVPLLEACETRGHVQSDQPPYSLVNRGGEHDVLPWCRAHGTGVIVYSPMQAGLLTGTFSEQRRAQLDSHDWRRRDRWFEQPRFGRVLELVSRLEPIAAEYDLSLPEIAVAWVIAHESVTGAIVGARNPAQVDGWIHAGIVDLSAGVADDLRGMAETILEEGREHVGTDRADESDDPLAPDEAS